MTHPRPDDAAPHSEAEITEPATDTAPATAADGARSPEPAKSVEERPEREPRHWKRWLIGGFILLIVVLIAVFIWTSFLPRWWSQTISRQTGGTFSGGVGLGLTLGFLFTLVPLLILGLALFRQWKHIAVRIVLAVVALIAAFPNLMTLSVSLGTGRAYDVARMTMDVSSPWFRGATLIGALLAAVLTVIIWVLGYIRRRRGRELKELKSQRK